MRRRERRLESDRLEKMAHKAQRRGDPSEASRHSKAADRKRRQEQAEQDNAPPPDYFRRRMYEIMKDVDARDGTNYAAAYAPMVPVPGWKWPRRTVVARSREELEAKRQEMKDKLDAIIADLERKAEEAEEEEPDGDEGGAKECGAGDGADSFPPATDGEPPDVSGPT